MPVRQGVLLTGATGLLGQYLLQDLLSQSIPVVVLARDSRKQTAQERIDQIVQFWSDRLKRPLAQPKVINGDLTLKNLGLTPTDQYWLGQNCDSILHSAASLSFRNNSSGEPWRTNLEGTRSLIDLCDQSGITRFHHVSTAFVSGRREGHIAESELNQGQSFNNAYEESKLQAELLLRDSNKIQTTIYRPSVIVGDSLDGHTTTFIGIYRFSELAVRLAAMHADENPGYLPLRIPLSGKELWNLVTVDWVSKAMVELISQPRHHGQTYHLVNQTPVATRFIVDIGLEMLGLRGVEFGGSGEIRDPNTIESYFLQGIEEYWPYLLGNPQFSTRNLESALPNFHAPEIEVGLLRRLITFGMVNQWGRGGAKAGSRSPSKKNKRTEQNPGLIHQPSKYGEYIETIFPKQVAESRLGREARLDLTIALDLQGVGGGQWSCQWNRGELVAPVRGLRDEASVIYQTDTRTLANILARKETPQQAFFDEKILIKGDMETGLKLAVLFSHFLTDLTKKSPDLPGVAYAAS